MNVEDLYRLLRTGHVQAQGIVDTVADPMLVLDGSLSVQQASRSFFDTFKVDRDDVIGKHIYELGNGQWDIPELRMLLMQVIPKSTAVINFQVEHDFPDLGHRTMLVTARTLHHPDKGSRLMLLSIVDATESSRREAARDMLFGELRHRMKNLLAVAQSIARQTTTRGRTAEEYRDAFLGRFTALVEAEDIAFAEQGEGDLAALVERVLAPYRDNPNAIVVEDGSPAVALGPATLVSLGIVLHELGTNAAKHGALSRTGGQIRIGWTVDEHNTRLRLTWAESGGPQVTAPTTTGYGTKLIQSTTSYSLGGKVEQTYAPEGLLTEITMPMGTTPAESH